MLATGLLDKVRRRDNLRRHGDKETREARSDSATKGGTRETKFDEETRSDKEQGAHKVAWLITLNLSLDQPVI